jgi:enolase
MAIVDPFPCEDWATWHHFQSRHPTVHVLGGELYVTHPKRILFGIEKHASTGVIIKPNQVGTLTETLQTIRIAQRNSMEVAISHCVGETNDTFIADLCVATNTKLIIAGGLARGERIAKYNQLIRIEEALGDDAVYMGDFVLREKKRT